MNDIATRKPATPLKRITPLKRPTRAEAEAAVRTLIAWAGDDPTREGLRDTPRRVTDAFTEYFSGYGQDPAEVLARQFEEAGGYDDLVMLRDIRVESHCEHHMAPFLGVAHVAYLPNGRIVGISKIARDIGERKNIEAALRDEESIRLLRATLPAIAGPAPASTAACRDRASMCSTSTTTR